MSKWLIVLLIGLTSNAFASPADSGRCPWKIPFHITLRADGLSHGYGQRWDGIKHVHASYDNGTHYSHDSIDVVIDSGYVFRSDSFISIIPIVDTVDDTGSQSLLIVFAHGKDSILHLEYVLDTMRTFNPSFRFGVRNTFVIDGLLFDDTSIFAPDSSFFYHNTTFLSEAWGYQDPDNYGYYDHEDFIASSISLSGIFRPTHFADQAAVAVAPASASGMEITASRGALRCSFSAAAAGRTLEVYSPVGIRVASYSVAAGAAEAQTKTLISGLYFVRLGSSIAKVYVAE